MNLVLPMSSTAKSGNQFVLRQMSRAEDLLKAAPTKEPI
jgi:hypothetical protein